VLFNSDRSASEAEVLLQVHLGRGRAIVAGAAIVTSRMLIGQGANSGRWALAHAGRIWGWIVCVVTATPLVPKRTFHPARSYGDGKPLAGVSTMVASGHCWFRRVVVQESANVSGALGAKWQPEHGWLLVAL